LRLSGKRAEGREAVRATGFQPHLQIGAEPGAAGEADVLLALRRLGQRARHHAPARPEQIDLKYQQRRLAFARIERVLQRVLETMPPSQNARQFDHHRRESRGSGSAPLAIYAVPARSGVRRVVEIGEVAGEHVHRAEC